MANEHLVRTQFKPGHAGGPGRPKRTPISDAYREILATEFPKDLAKKMGLRIGSTWLDAIALQGARAALRTTDGGTAARKEIRESVEGKAPMRFEVRQDGEIEFLVSF